MYMRVELIDANKIADIKEELLLQANLFLLLVPDLEGMVFNRFK